MCVIYACSTELPPEEELHRGAFRNDDGAGLAWLEKHKGELQVFWKKGLKDEKEVLEFIQKQKIPLPLAIHFRTASVGGKCGELCHPFPLEPEVNLALEGHIGEVLFHNGHLNNWEDLVLKTALGMDCKVPEGEWSDSRALAWITHLKGPGILNFINNTSRILLFHAEPDVWEGYDYDRAHDHFTLYGGWEREKDQGWAQSVKTDWGGPKVIKGHSYRDESWFGKDDDIEDLVKDACGIKGQPKVEPLKASNSALTSVWTVAELKDILDRIEKEIGDARTSAGI